MNGKIINFEYKKPKGKIFSIAVASSKQTKTFWLALVLGRGGYGYRRHFCKFSILRIPYLLYVMFCCREATKLEPLISGSVVEWSTTVLPRHCFSLSDYFSPHRIAETLFGIICVIQTCLYN
jgi:hypothetical protein